MKTLLISELVVLAVTVLTPQITQAQGIVYVSNLSDPSTGSAAVGSGSWFAADFITGTNAGGYDLNSVQLAMADATGSPTGFTAMIYTSVSRAGAGFPGSSLDTLDGSANPFTAGIYTYTPAANITLSPNTVYFLVATAGTTVASGAYDWNVTSTDSPGYSSYHWGGETFFPTSSNGKDWYYASSTYGEFALTATAAPEPSASWLLLLGGGALIYVRRIVHR
jgi:hypothetical protein